MVRHASQPALFFTGFMRRPSHGSTGTMMQVKHSKSEIAQQRRALDARIKEARTLDHKTAKKCEPCRAFATWACRASLNA